MTQSLVKGQRLEFDIISPVDGEILGRKGKKVSKVLCKKLDAAGIVHLPVSKESLFGEILAKTIVNKETGEVIALCNTELTETLLETLEAEGIDEF